MKGAIFYVAIIIKGSLQQTIAKVIFSQEKISSFRTKAHLAFHCCLHNI